MQTVRLYGNLAATFHYGKDVIRSMNGVIDVPAPLVAQALSLGFTREQTGPDVAQIEAPAPVAALSAGEIAPASLPAKTEDTTFADKVAKYEKEARDEGFEIDDVAKIVQERLRFDDLIASGKTKDEAIAAIWGPSVGDVSEIAAKETRDAIDAKLDGQVDARIKPPAAPETGETGEGKE